MHKFFILISTRKRNYGGMESWTFTSRWSTMPQTLKIFSQSTDKPKHVGKSSKDIYTLSTGHRQRAIHRAYCTQAKQL